MPHVQNMALVHIAVNTCLGQGPLQGFAFHFLLFACGRDLRHFCFKNDCLAFLVDEDPSQQRRLTEGQDPIVHMHALAHYSAVLKEIGLIWTEL